MDAYYFKDHIKDELEGAKHYMTKAMECKADGLSWAKKFDEMAMAELQHAESLYNMFIDYYKQFDSQPELKEYMNPFREELTSDFMKCSAEIRYMHEMYTK